MRQEERILEHLKQIGTISGREAEDLYRVRDLPKRISVLKREGHSIERLLKTDMNGQRYARYFMQGNRSQAA